MPRTYSLHRTQWAPRPLSEIFAFFSDAANLEALTPGWLKFEVVTPRPITMFAGTHIDYRLRWHGIPLRWTTEITRWDPPHEFQDVQLKGPYKLWRHTHRFIKQSGGTALTDVVEYALPFGPLGSLAHALQVRRNIEQIFDYRYDRIRDMFGGPPQS